MRKNWKKLINEIENAEKIAVFMHHSADGDAIGSAYALASALIRGGKDVCVYSAEVFENKFDFLNVADAPTVIVGTEEEVEKIGIGEETLAIVVDCANLDRLAPLTKALATRAGKMAKIDHHLKCPGSDYAELDYSDIRWSATCEGLYGFVCKYLEMKGLELDSGTAKCLYAGILTDTGKFVYSSTTGDTLRIVAKLVDVMGPIGAKIARDVFDVRSKRTVAFVTRATSKTEYYFDGKLAVVYLADEDFLELGCTKEDTIVLPNEVLNVEGVEVSVIIRPLEIGKESEKKYKVSMRCIDGHNVAMVCNAFNGGGHVCAAGCRFDGDVDAFKARMLEEFQKMGL